MNLIRLPSTDPIPDPLWNPGSKHLTSELLDVWRDSLSSLGAPPAAQRALDVLPEAQIVVTGQQPGVWGGPLYSAYKAATAVALAQRIQGETGKPAVAVFWMGADDTDHDEVGWGCLPNPRGRLFRYRWPAPPDSRSWVGDRIVEFPTGVDAFLEAVPFSWGAPDPQQEISLGDGFTRFLYELLGNAGLLVLDSRWPEISRAALPLWERYLNTHEQVSESVREQGKLLLAQGLPEALGEQTERGLFLIQERKREGVEPATWETDVREALGQNRQVTPSVLLRAVLQDYLFGTAAHVVGRGEISYLRQVEPVYSILNVHRPPRVPRLHGTVVPRSWMPDDQRAEALRNPEAYVSSQAKGAGGGIQDLKDSIQAGLKSLGEGFSKEQAVGEVIGSAEKKIHHQLERLGDSLNRQSRRELYRERPHLRHLPEFLLPRRAAQDRGLSAVSLMLWLGEDCGHSLLGWARKHVQAMERGEACSWIMEINDD